MSIFSQIERRMFGGQDDIEERTITAVSGFGEAFTGTGTTFAGRNVTQDSALTLGAVWSCVSLIADAVAGLPVDVTQSFGEVRRPVKSPVWLETPNPFDTPVDFWGKIMTSLLLDGNAFVRVLRNGNRRVVALLPLDPTAVRVELTEDQGAVVFKTGDQTFTSADVIHVKGFSSANSLRGLSPIDYARQAIGSGLAVEEFGARFFSQGTTMSGLIQHPGKPTPGETAMLSRMMKKTHVGADKSHAVGVLTGGATFTPISVTPEQAQFLDTQKLNRTGIASIFRVPSYMLAPETASSWGSGVEEQHSFFVQQTLSIWITRIESALSVLLPPGQSLRFNVNARMRAKTVERYAAYEVAIRAGFMTVNEVRSLEDREPLPNGDSMQSPAGGLSNN